MGKKYRKGDPGERGGTKRGRKRCHDDGVVRREFKKRKGIKSVKKQIRRAQGGSVRQGGNRPGGGRQGGLTKVDEHEPCWGLG